MSYLNIFIYFQSSSYYCHSVLFLFGESKILMNPDRKKNQIFNVFVWLIKLFDDKKNIFNDGSTFDCLLS